MLILVIVGIIGLLVTKCVVSSATFTQGGLHDHVIMMNKDIYLSAHVVLVQLPTFGLVLCLFVYMFCSRIGREAKLAMKRID